jgi:hypothetical protein
LCAALFAGDIHEFLTEDTRKVTDIKRVLQVELVRRFMAKWLELKRTYGTLAHTRTHTRPHVWLTGGLGSYAEEARPRLGFHGTPEANIPNILQQGLLVPGTHGVINRTDDGTQPMPFYSFLLPAIDVRVRARGSGLGYYGAGIYLSPDARTSLGYAGGCGKLLVCAVLMGRIYKCEDLMHGAPCTPGTSAQIDASIESHSYLATPPAADPSMWVHVTPFSAAAGFDSHMSPCEGELILFEAAQVRGRIHDTTLHTRSTHDTHGTRHDTHGTCRC